MMNITRITYLIKQLLIIASLFLFCLSLASARNIDVSISGVSKEIESSIKENLSLDSINDTNKITLNNIEQEINNILIAYGYYNVKILVSADEKSTPKKINVAIKLNKPILIRNININYIDNNQYKNKKYQIPSEISNLINNYRRNVNTPFNQIEYENFKENLLQAARNNGYQDAQYQVHQVLIDKNKNLATINIILDLKNIYYINNIIITSDDNTFIFKFIPYNFTKIDNNKVQVHSAPYRSSEILELQNALSKYYREINIKTNVNTSNHTVDLYLSPLQLRNYLYKVGLGYGTDEGARVFGGLQVRNISNNLHKLDLQAKLAQYRELIDTNYIMPGYFLATDIITIGYQYRSDKKRSDNNLEKERHQLISQYQQTLKGGDLLLTGGLSYRNEKYRDIARQKSESSQLLVPYFIYDQVVTDDRIKSYYGHHINMMIEAANDGILSSTSFARLQTKLKSIIPINLNDNISGLRFIGRGQFGQVWHDRQEKIPPTLRFFAGGSETVRGYRFESLGPKEINSKGKSIIVGGDRLIVISTELEKQIYNNWSTALFYDAGNAYNTWDNWADNLKSGAGFGVRWQSPLGALRFDFAKPLDKESDEWRIDFNIGPDL